MDRQNQHWRGWECGVCDLGVRNKRDVTLEINCTLSQKMSWDVCAQKLQTQARAAASKMTPNLPGIVKDGGWVIYDWNELKLMCSLLRKLEIKPVAQRHHSVAVKLPTEAERGGRGRKESVKLKVFWRATKEWRVTDRSNSDAYEHEREAPKHCLIAGDFNSSEIEYKANVADNSRASYSRV